MTFAARTIRGLKAIAGLFADPSKRVIRFSWSVVQSQYPRCTIVLDHVTSRAIYVYNTDPATTFIVQAQSYVSYQDQSVQSITARDQYGTLLDGFNLAPGQNVAQGWSIRLRQVDALPLPRLKQSIDSASLTVGTWYPWNQQYDITNYRPETTNLQTYAYLDLSNDGGATVAMTVYIDYIRSSSQ